MSIGAKVALQTMISDSMNSILTVDQAQKLREAILLSMSGFDVEKTTDPTNTNCTDLLESFLQAKRTEGCSDKTIKHYRYVISKTMESVGVPVGMVTIHHLRSYLAKEEERGICGKTRQNIRNVICSFFHWLSVEELIQKDPSANLHSVKVQKKVKVPFSSTDIEKLKENCKSLRDLALVEFLLSTGCRISEVIGVKRDEVDLAKKEVIVLGKGNKERTVYLDEVSCMHLSRYLQARTDSCDALFINRSGERITADGARSMLVKLGKNSGVSNVHPHRFRRTLATGLINRGMPIQDVSTILGHSNINVTMTYVYIDNKSTKNRYMQYTV